MKNSLFLLGAAAVVALSSCTKNEVLEVAENRAIGFDAFTPNGTRAVSDMAGNGSGTFNKFYVYGSYANKTAANTTVFTNTTVFNGETVSYNSGNSGWGYSPAQYWQNGNYKFAAYSNGNDKINERVTYTHDDGLQIANYTVGTSDLLYATATANVEDKTMYNKSVDFTFNHILSKVKFTFDSSSFADNLHVTVSNLQIDNSNKIGTYNGSAWTSLSGSGAITYNTIDVNASTYTAEECYVLPQRTENLTASFTVTVTDALGATIMTKSFSKVSLNVTNNETWAAGFVYNYTTDLTEKIIDPNGGQSNPIVFTGTASVWKNNASGDGNLGLK